jgi:RNA polymerase primary sigma factor
MPRTRGAASTRSDTRRARGEHDNQTQTQPTGERRAVSHAPEPTTDSLQLFFNQAARYPLLTKEEEVELAQRIERGDLAAKERLINSNLRLVIKFARRYQGHGLDLGDLVQEAMLGLIRAAHVAQRERTVNRVTAELTAKLDREATDEEVAKEAKLPLDEVMAIRDMTRVTASLDQPIGDGDTTFGELHAESTADLEDEVLERQQEQTVEDALAKLPEDERRVISARFGTGGRQERNLRDVAREVGVTQEQARRLEAQALRRLAQDDSLNAWREAA